MTTIYSPDTIFAVGISINTTNRDIDDTRLLEISMATYNTNFKRLDQTTVVISCNPETLMLDGETAKMHVKSGLIDDLDHGSHSVTNAEKYLVSWLDEQLAYNEYLPHLLSNDVRFVHNVLDRFMPEVFARFDARAIDATTVKLLAEAQGVDISLPKNTNRAKNSVHRAAQTIVQGYINAVAEQPLVLKHMDQYTLPGRVIDDLRDNADIVNYAESSHYSVNYDKASDSTVSAALTLNEYNSSGDNITVTVSRLLHETVDSNGATVYDAVDISTNVGDAVQPKRVYFSDTMSYDDFRNEVYDAALDIARDAIATANTVK